MPGIHFVCNLSGDAEKGKMASPSVLETLCYDEDYRVQSLLSEKDHSLSCVAYDNYPVAVFENDEFYVCLEGRIYEGEQESLGDNLLVFAERLFGEEGCTKEFLAEWLLNTDGEFVIFMKHKSSRKMLIINDIFSRLPVYHYQKDDRVIVSRDYHFVSSLIDNKKFDRMSIAQYLLFGFCLGTRTHLEDVEILAPSSMISVDIDKSSYSREVVHEFDFSIKENKHKSVKKNAEALLSIYTEACKRRAGFNSQTLLSLSGGLDSRTVGAGLHSAGVQFKAVSMLDSAKGNQLDVDTAGEVANALGIDWEKYELGPGFGKEALKALKIKSGLLFIGGSHLIKFLGTLKKKYGSDVVMFSGNGGDRIAHDIRPYKEVKTIDDLIKFVLSGGPNRSGIGVEVVSELMQLSVDEILGEFKRVLESYPEKKTSQKFVHFNIYEQCFRRHHEGDDRKRSFFWGTSPYWSVHVFKHLMNCPDSQKYNRYFCSKFMSLLNPEVSEVPYAVNLEKTRTSISMDKYAIYQLAYRMNKLPNPVRFLIKKLKKLIAGPVVKKDVCYKHPDIFVNCMKDQICNCSAISECFSKTALEKTFDNSEKFRPVALGILFTAVSAVEYIESGKSSIEKYCESKMEVHGWVPPKR